MEPSLKIIFCSALLTLSGFAEANWKSAKTSHLQQTQARKKLVSQPEDLKYFAEDLQNDKNFVANLDKILVVRPVGSQGHESVRQHIVNQMRDLGWDIEQHQFTDNTPKGEKSFTNIVATMNSAAPRRMVIACHYDSLANPTGFLGAVDSAVPCAMMINLATVLHQDLKLTKAKNSDLSLQFIFFDGEEAFVQWSSTDSIYGARNLAAKWEKTGYSHEGVSGNDNDRIDIFVLLDLIGTSDTQFSQLERSTGGWYNRLVDIESSLRSMGFLSGSQLFQKGFIPAGIEDDHIPFKKRSVPILHLISVPFPSVWHKMSDNRESLDFDRISNLSKILRVFTAEYLNMAP